MSRDEEVRKVATQIDGLLDKLRDNVAAMNSILTRPAPDSGEANERLVAPCD